MIRTNNFASQEETDVTNNCYPVAITVTEPLDLVVSAASGPATIQVGAQGQVSFTVLNQGGGDAAGEWADGVYLSSYPFLDATATLLTSEGHVGEPALGPGGSYSRTQTITIPGNTPTGDRYLLFVADHSSQLPELIETNNVRSVAVKVLPAPDLVVTAATAPASALVGGLLAVSFTVKNQGGAGAAATWNDAVYVSDDQALDAGDTFVGSAPIPASTPAAPTRST